ncbi:ADP-ribosylglycohydrolase family protein [Microcoleus sp. ZQ-A2]
MTNLPIIIKKSVLCSQSSLIQGCLLGLAIGDAVGASLEFKRPGTFTPMNDMVGGGSFGRQPGQWTDGTSMALCLAESLIEPSPMLSEIPVRTLKECFVKKFNNY